MGKVVRTIATIAVMVAIAVAVPALTPALVKLGVSAAVATAIVTVGLTLAAGVAMKALGLTPRAGVPSAFGGTPGMYRQTIGGSIIVYGERRVGGQLVFYYPRKSGKTHYRYFVIAVTGHSIQGVTTWMLNDKVVSVNGSGMVTSGPYKDKSWLWMDNGSDAATANATFVAECGGYWTAAHRGRGISKIYAKFEMSNDLVQEGMPNITAIIRGKNDIMDPRTATAGYTNNAALVFYDWMRVAREEGGFGAYPEEIPSNAFIAAQANVCDEMIPAPANEKRYRLDAVLISGATPSEIRDSLILCCAGSFTYSDGKFLMRPGYYVPPTATLQLDDLAGPFTVSAFDSGDNAANQVTGAYIDPTQKYLGAPFTTQTTGAAVADIRQLDLDLAHVTSRYQAERVARITLRRAQADKTVAWPMNVAGLGVAALDNVQIATSRYGLSNYVYQVQRWALSVDFSISLGLREDGPAIYADGDETPPVAPPTLPDAEIIGDEENQVFIEVPGVVNFNADYQGTVVDGQLPYTIAPKVTRGSENIKLLDTTSYAITAVGVTATVDNTNGSPTKGNITVTGVEALNGSIELTVTVNGFAYPSKQIITAKGVGIAPGIGGDSAKVASDNTFPKITLASLVPISDSLRVNVAAGEKLYGTAPLSYYIEDIGAQAGRTVTAVWQYYDTASSTWVAFGGGVTGTEAREAYVAGIAPNLAYIDAVPGSVNVNQSVNVAPAIYDVRLAARLDAPGKTVYFIGMATIEAKV